MLIDRVPRGEQIVKGRSHCDNCSHILEWFDLVPVFSWLLLKGKCRYCHKQVPVRNTLVELLTGLIFAAAYWNLVSGIKYQVSNIEDISKLLISLIILSCLIAVFFIDLTHKIIPDSLTIVASIGVVLLNFILPFVFPDSSHFSFLLPSPINYLLSAIGASAFFLFLVVITRGRGMGIGDVKFAGFMGIFLGYPTIVYSLYFAFLTGGIVSAILVLRKKKRFGQTIPFGPFLVLGTVLAYFKILEFLWVHIYGNFL